MQVDVHVCACMCMPCMCAPNILPSMEVSYFLINLYFGSYMH